MENKIKKYKRHKLSINCEDGKRRELFDQAQGKLRKYENAFLSFIEI